MNDEQVQTMKLVGISASVTGVAALLSALLAACAFWLLLAQPSTVATAYQRGDLSPVLDALSRLVVSTFQSLVRYL